MQVTIYAAALPPETTSNVAGVQWWPSYVYDEGALTPALVDRHTETQSLDPISGFHPEAQHIRVETLGLLEFDGPVRQNPPK